LSKHFDSIKQQISVSKNATNEKTFISMQASSSAFFNLTLQPQEYCLKLLGRKVTGSGQVIIEIKSDSKVVIEKTILFSKTSVSELDIRFEIPESKQYTVRMHRSSSMTGSIEISRVIISTTDQPILKPSSLREIPKADKLNTSSKLKMCAIIPYNIFGGAEVYLKNIYEKISDKVSITYIFLGKSYKFISLTSIPSTTFFEAKSLEAMSGYIAASNFDCIIYYNRKDVYDQLISLKNAGLSSKLIEIYHSDFVWPGSLAATRERDNIDCMISVSENLGRDIFSVKRRYTIPVGIDLSLFRIKPYEPKKQIYRYSFVTVARLSKEKNLDYIVKLAKVMPDCSFTIIGEGPEENILKSMAGKNVIFLGFKSDVWNYLQGFDAFILPSNIEGTPISIIEAMAMNLKIIHTDVGDISNLTHGTGLVLSLNEKSDAENIISFVNSNTDNVSIYARAYHDIEENSFNFLSAVYSVCGFDKFQKPNKDVIIIDGEIL
jgi:glycosyltransferase involved in cell wall biosynthesis